MCKAFSLVEIVATRGVLEAVIAVDIAIDFEAFSLCHVTPSAYIDLVENERCGWAKRFNQFLKSLSSAVSEQKGFF